MKLLLFASLSLVLLGPSLCQATLCYVKQGRADCFERGGEKMEGRRSYSPCDAVTAICPGATLCYTNLQGGISCVESDAVLERARREGGAHLDIAALSSSRNQPSFLQVLKEIFFPQPQISVGMKRFASHADLPGFPDGYILMPDDALSFSSLDLAHARIERFTLWQTDAAHSLLSLDHPGAQIRIPVTLLIPGQTYRWEVISGGDEFTGGFSIETPDYQQEFDQELRETLAHSDSAAASRHIVRAALARKYGYSFDYLQALRRAREEIGGERQ